MTYQPPPQQPQPPQPPYGQPQYGQPPYGQPQYGQAPYAQPPYAYQASGNGAATASLIVGICSVVFCWIPIIGPILAIVALITGIIGVQKPVGRGMGVAGLIMGALMLVLDVAFILFFVIAASAR